MAAISKTPSGSYRGVFTSQPIDAVVDVVNNLTGNGTSNPTQNLYSNGTLIEIPQLLTAAGSTQGGAAAITSSFAVISVATTNSSKGVRLPVASTGKRVTVANIASHGAKVYPATNARIISTATNVGLTLLKTKTNVYRAVNTTVWVAETGA